MGKNGSVYLPCILAQHTKDARTQLLDIVQLGQMVVLDIQIVLESRDIQCLIDLTVASPLHGQRTRQGPLMGGLVTHESESKVLLCGGRFSGSLFPIKSQRILGQD